MRAVLLVAALALVLVSAGASAQTAPGWANGNDMKAYCHSNSRYWQGACEGFAMAVATIVSRTPVSSYRACIPVGVTGRQLGDIMVKHLDDHPELLHYTATSIAAEAFAIAFPCPK